MHVHVGTLLSAHGSLVDRSAATLMLIAGRTVKLWTSQANATVTVSANARKSLFEQFLFRRCYPNVIYNTRTATFGFFIVDI